MPRDKSVFTALFFAVIVMMICCLGCIDEHPTIGQEICAVACKQVGGEFRYQRDHICVCRFQMPHFKIQDIPSTKEDTSQKPDKSANGANMVIR